MIAAKLALFGTALSVLAASRLWEIPSWYNANLLEIIWTLIGVLMITVSTAVLPRLVTDYQLISLMSEEVRDAAHVLAHSHIRREVVRLVQGVIMTIIGVYGCATPHPVPGPVIVTTASLVLTAGLFSLGVLTIVQSVLDWRQRTRAEALLAEEIAEQ